MMRSEKAFISKTSVLFMLIFLSKSVFLRGACIDTVEISFDRLFPKTAFGYVLESCMQLCEDLQQLHVSKAPGHTLDFFSDMLVGKLFHLKTSIENMRCQRPAVHPEDIAYLILVFDEMLSCYKSKSVSYKHTPQIGYVSHLIGDIKKKLMSFE